MKMGTKRGSTAAVLEAPEDSYTSASAYSHPAPVGSLRRGYDAGDGAGADAADRSSYSRRANGARGAKGLRVRFRGLPRTLSGRLMAGGALLLVAGILGAVGLVVRQYLTHSERFLLASADQVEVLGNHELSRSQALGVFANDLDRNIFHMSLAEREADLERLPWVQHATVMRLLPNRLRVAIVERTPVAFVRQGTQIGLVDATGVLLDMPSDAAGDPHYSFPVLTGISAADPLSTRKARMGLYTDFMKAMAAGGEQITDSLSEVDVTDPEDVKAIVARDGSDILVHFGDENFLARYQTFDQHLPEWRQMYPKLVSADMRYYSKIVLNSGTAGPPAPVSTATGPSAADAAAAALAAAPKAATPAAKVAALPKSKTAQSKAGAGKPQAGIAAPHPLTLNKTAHPVKKVPAASHPRPKQAHPAGGPQR
ncbi:cell division protein FtsQ [Bryocella elongata]|uniref:Cell division protein FtsQ n=1 Tax=Bryocella elongata TaxID=863522 RepID=A0A1H5WPT6_9BACT|nr:FtsQ-type POTRA domain-containing protein [Bryocella elongata]SEG01434.1 cell division protein FtsQ [Bryocella elongata]